MADKFVLITFKDEDIAKTPYKNDAWHNASYLADQILTINLAYDPSSDKAESIAPEFISKLKEFNKNPTSAIGRKIFDFENFNISENDVVYILHHHSNVPAALNTALNNAFKENKTKFIYPYSTSSGCVDFDDVFPNNLENAESLKNNIQNAITKYELLIKSKEEDDLFNQYEKRLKDEYPGCEIKLSLLKIKEIIKNDLDQDTRPFEFTSIYDDKDTDLKPVLFTGMYNLFVEKNDRYDMSVEFKKALHPRYRFFDSSIWFRYVPLSQLEKLFPKYIKECQKNKDYFGLPEAIEFREFVIRQFNESYIKNNGSGHSDHIAPYGFHSESKMEKWAEEEASMINGFKWNFLIIDDGFSEDTDTNPLKRTLINDVINDYRANDDYYEKTIQKALYDKIIIKASGDVNPENSNTKGATSSVETESKRQNTFKMLLNCARFFKDRIFPKAEKSKNPNSPTDSHTKYDIILLDYYFRDNSHGQAEFGEEFLIQLLQPEKADTEKEYLTDKYLGPTGKFWIFPISVYSTSLVDKLRDNRITWYDDKWIISPGADPLNTPELFRYKIYSFMRRQLEEFSIQYRDEKEKSNPQKKLFPQLAFYLISFMFSMDESEQLKDNDIICKWVNRVRPSTGSDEIKNVQKYMIDIFPKIVEQGVKFKRLCKNKETSSLAGTVIEKFYFNFKKYDWDHFQNLIYLVAYGNRSNLDQVWNELNYIESRYNEIIQEKNKDKNHNYDEVLKFFIAVVKAYLE